MNTGDVVYDGGEGDDYIWANFGNNNSRYSKYYGGNGDDILKGMLTT